jgi:hypothetical protein
LYPRPIRAAPAPPARRSRFNPILVLNFIKQDVRLPDFFRHTRESGYPFFSTRYWIPAYAGMTKSESPVKNGKRFPPGIAHARRVRQCRII